MAANKPQPLPPVLVVRMHIRFGASYSDILRRDVEGREHVIARVESFQPPTPESSNVKPSLRDALESGIRRVVIDLADVIVLSSVALAELVEWRAMVTRHGGTLLLAAPSSRVIGIFEVTKLSTVFEVRASLDDAVGELLETAEPDEA